MICVPLRSKTVKPLLAKIKTAEKSADLTEIWFDDLGKNLSTSNLTKIFSAAKKPILYKALTDLTAIKLVLGFKPAYIDLDYQTPKHIIKEVKSLSPKTQIIISFHDFKATPTDKKLKSIIKKMQKHGADIVKLATTAKTFADSIRMLGLLSANSPTQKTIFICMGKKGKITRAAGHLFGNYLMYSPLKLSQKTADGQIPLKELRQLQNLI